MQNSNFNESLKVDKENLIPIDPKQRCLWVMGATAKAFNFGLMLQEAGATDTKAYQSYNYSINHFLGDLEFDFREGKISEAEFRKRCEEVYEQHAVDFNALRDNLADFQRLEEMRKRRRIHRRF